MRQRAAPVDRRKRMRKAVNFHDSDVMIGQQLDDSRHETGDEERDVATRYVRRAD